MHTNKYNYTISFKLIMDKVDKDMGKHMDKDKHNPECIAFTIHGVDRETIIRMVKEEQSVRYSKGVQEAYTIQYMNANHKEVVNIEREVQQFILRKFGFKDDMESLEQYWKIPSTYWNDAEIKNNLFYMKLNIFNIPKWPYMMK